MVRAQAFCVHRGPHNPARWHNQNLPTPYSYCMVRAQACRAPRCPDTRSLQPHNASRLRPSSPSCTSVGVSFWILKQPSAASLGRSPKSSNECHPRRPREPFAPCIPPSFLTFLGILATSLLGPVPARVGEPTTPAANCSKARNPCCQTLRRRSV